MGFPLCRRENWCALSPGHVGACQRAAPVDNPVDTVDNSVHHPNHYGGDTVYETIKVIEAWGLGFHLGNAVKYISRAGKKDPARTREDLEKAKWYLERYLETMDR